MLHKNAKLMQAYDVPHSYDHDAGAISAGLPEKAFNLVRMTH